MKICFGKTEECSDGQSTEQIGIRNSGYYIDLISASKCNRPRGRLDYQLIICAKGEGEIILNKRKCQIGTGNIILYKPHEPQTYTFTAGSSYSFIHFSGTEIPALLTSLNYLSKSSARILYKRMYKHEQYICEKRTRCRNIRHRYIAYITLYAIAYNRSIA